MRTFQDIQERFSLKAHPEGGFYNECYRSEQQVMRGECVRTSCTHIYYALRGAGGESAGDESLGGENAGEYSAWHRVHSDEIWNFYEGADLELHCLSPDCSEHQVFRLGAGHEYAAVIPAGYWQAARCLGGDESYSLMGCSVAPGFEFSDFMLLRDHPRQEGLAEGLRALL